MRRYYDVTCVKDSATVSYLADSIRMDDSGLFYVFSLMYGHVCFMITDYDYVTVKVFDMPCEFDV